MYAMHLLQRFVLQYNFLILQIHCVDTIKVLTGENYTHKQSLPQGGGGRKINLDLTNSNLLKHCLHGHTQNPNECK